MKTIVSVQEIEELEVKPPAEVARWRKLVADAIASAAASGEGWIASKCPCCDEDEPTPAFVRHGVEYVECAQCQTLFARRRPGEAALASWYRDSEPAKFWRDRLLRASEQVRRDKIIIPRAQWILEGRAEYVRDASTVVDVSANGLSLLKELRVDAPELKITATGLGVDAASKTPGIAIAPTDAADLAKHGPADIVVAVDAFDRAPDLRALVRAIHATLRTGGVVFATLPVASGFEVQTLWDRSPTVVPPDKVNLPTIDGLMRLFAHDEWELLELSTPGVFDVDLVLRVMAAAPEGQWPRAVRALMANQNESARRMFTEYLQSQRRTSFARLAARRRA